MRRILVLLILVLVAGAQAQERDLTVLKKLYALIGGKWRGQVKSPEGPLLVEFTYRKHPDGEGVVGEGQIGKGSKHPIYVRTQFGWDQEKKAIYYFDSHNSATVYYGWVRTEGEDFVFEFGPAGGTSTAFNSRSRFDGRDTLTSIIRNAKGEEQVGLTLKRVR